MLEKLAKQMESFTGHLELMVTSSHILLLKQKVQALDKRQQLEAQFEREKLLLQLKDSPSLPLKSKLYEVTKVSSAPDLTALLLSKVLPLLQPTLIHHVLNGNVQQVVSTPAWPSKDLTLFFLNATAAQISFSQRSLLTDSPGVCQWQIWPNTFISYKASGRSEFEAIKKNICDYLDALLSGDGEKASDYYAKITKNADLDNFNLQGLLENLPS